MAETDDHLNEFKCYQAAADIYMVNWMKTALSQMENWFLLAIKQFVC